MRRGRRTKEEWSEDRRLLLKNITQPLQAHRSVEEHARRHDQGALLHPVVHGDSCGSEPAKAAQHGRTREHGSQRAFRSSIRNPPPQDSSSPSQGALSSGEFRVRGSEPEPPLTCGLQVVPPREDLVLCLAVLVQVARAQKDRAAPRQTQQQDRRAGQRACDEPRTRAKQQQQWEAFQLSCLLPRLWRQPESPSPKPSASKPSKPSSRHPPTPTATSCCAFSGVAWRPAFRMMSESGTAPACVHLKGGRKSVW